jgi:hypothetical protein
MDKPRIVLDETDFRALVAGHVVDKGDALIMLQDIGVDRMFGAVERVATRDGRQDSGGEG